MGTSAAQGESDQQMLSLQAALRTLGYGLEACHSPRARLHVSRVGLSVAGSGAYGVRSYRWPELVHEAREQAQQRGLLATAHLTPDPWTLTRWSALLRVIGALLDARGMQTFAIEATVQSVEPPRDCEARVVAEGREILDGPIIAQQLEWLRLRYAMRAPERDDTSRTRRWWTALRAHVRAPIARV